MISAGFDALIFIGNPVFFGIGMANMRYMFQVKSEAGATCLFTLQGEPVIWNGPPHTQRPTNAYLGLQEWVSDFRPTFGVPAIAQEVKDRGLDRSRIGLVAYSSPLLPTPTFFHQQIVDLHKFLPNAELTDTTWLIQEMRMVKTEIEIDMLRQAGKISRKVIDAMVNTSRPGISEAEVYAEMIRTQIANGAEPKIFNFFGSGPVEHD
jgi:Xaa-Pro aminopeptidase